MAVRYCSGRARRRDRPEYSDRRSDASNAKAALLEKFKSATAAPDLAVKLAVRAEVARARDARRAARDAEKLEQLQIAAAEAAAVVEEDVRRQAAEAAAIEASQRAQDRRIALVLSDEAARKTARDLRYAKRKAAQLVA
ncbi:hypothetical protein EBL89_16175 [Cereibacter sphaeroides]|uniref:DUF6481 family protein n=1 Tax=Cereibacter sphaeroides TaxID=1063 RepID=UPI000F5294CA|nr:DUF6481 family protein [Cereibacter sphaeroides]AZB56758.1 hypothetical protein EBL89_16175 [Cereibacter sphaeroides]